MHTLFLIVVQLVVLQVKGAVDLGFDNDLDLTTFVTRPDIRAPLFDVDIFDRNAVTPGYWFIAPYANIAQERFARRYYQPCQTGPAIYDGNGDLVWTGACMVENQNVCDLRLSEYNSSYALSSIFLSSGEGKKGQGIIMDSSYTVVKNISVPKLVRNFNMHEFKVIHGGKSALYIISRPEYVELDKAQGNGAETGWILNLGFQEVDIDTGHTVFQWWAYPEVQPHESKVAVQGLEGPPPTAWNWFHMNSIDKDSHGDYLVSSRFTDTIFKISGKSGQIDWRLEGSGKMSNFIHKQGFNFSRQHDAQWHEHSDDREVISLFDNASDGFNSTSTYSSVLMIELDKRSAPWTARVLERWVRPDKSLSHLRGNAQFLENRNLFTCWSDNSYLTEHSSGGNLVMTAAFRSKRFVTYRGYKFNFTGTPKDPPTLKAFVYGTSLERSTTVSYVSWNGATEVSSWSFYNTSNVAGTAVHLGRRLRTGFETSFQSDGYVPFIYAEALTSDGTIVGRTPTYEVEAPADWIMTTPPTERHSSGEDEQLHTVDALGADQRQTYNNLTDIASSGCSVYSGGCKPSIPRNEIHAVLLERTEL